MLITVLTPTYNRKKYLLRLFESLCSQTSQEFQWIVIDDGSSDGTDEWFVSLPETAFVKNYYKKENGGKHTALNYAHPYIMGELTFIVDSDDYLTENAVEIIAEKWEKYRDNDEICGMTFLRGYNTDRPFDNVHFPYDGCIESSIQAKVNAKKSVDSAEVIRTCVLREFPLPEFAGEKFMGESYLWNLSGYKYKTVYFNSVIYIGEYLERGLTDLGRKLRIQSPQGGMINSRTYFDRRVCFKQRIKNMWLYICYGQFCGRRLRFLMKDSKKRAVVILNYPFGKILYWYWERKYLNEKNVDKGDAYE